MKNVVTCQIINKISKTIYEVKKILVQENSTSKEILVLIKEKLAFLYRHTVLLSYYEKVW